MEKSTKKDDFSGRHDAQDDAQSRADKRRRMSRIVHDDRGNASVQWHDAPADYERPVFEIESGTGTHRRLDSRLRTDGLSLEQANAFDPYASSRPVERKPTPKTGTTTRTDLRKLSEWIKMMREIEERKLRGESEPEEG